MAVKAIRFVIYWTLFLVYFPKQQAVIAQCQSKHLLLEFGLYLISFVQYFFDNLAFSSYVSIVMLPTKFLLV